jgi:PAS domain S-box-containing protein
VYRSQPVSCSDIVNDDRWSQAWRDLCVAHGIFACHSRPVMSAQNLPLGSLMLCFDEARRPTDWEYQLADFGTQIASIAFERDRANLALRESETKYRTLFESIDEGFCIVEMIFDSENKPIDYRFLIANPAFDKQTGKKNAVGKTVREMAPQHEDYWFEIYGKVALTGQSIRFENRAREFQRWYEVHAFRVGKPELRQVGILFNDITDRKHTEEALRHSEEQLRLATEGADLGMWYWDAATNILTWTDRAKAMFGLPADIEMSMQVFLEAVHPDDRTFVNAVVSELRAGKGHNEIEYRTLRPDGIIRWILAKGDYAYSPDGTLLATRGVLLDITHRKQTELNEQFLNRLDRELRQLSAAETMAQTAIGKLGEYLKVDRALWDRIDLVQGTAIVEQDWCRQEVPSVVGTYRICDFILPDLAELFRSGQPAIVSDVTTHRHTAPQADNFLSLNIRALVGVPCICEGRWVATLAVQSRTVRHWQPEEVSLLQEFVVHLWSLIEHTRALEELRHSEAELRHLANAMPQIVWISNADGSLDFINDRWTEYTGIDREQSRDRALREEAIVPEDRESLHAEFLRAQETRAPYQSQFRLIQPDGSLRYFLTRATPIQDDRGQIRKWYGTSTDITELKQLEAERSRLLAQEQAAREAAETANRLKDEFLAVLSHELRSPLNPILGWTRLLQTGKINPTRQAEALATIERNAVLQTQLIEDLLDISRIMQGKLSLTTAPVNLTLTIAAALETVSLAAEAKQIEIQLDLAEEIPPVVGDAARLQQVLWNLLANAVKFTPNGGRVTIQLLQLERTARIRVADTGKGINPEFLPHVFDYFRQEDGSTTRKFGGLGLGLAIVRQIVEMHGGTVTAESPGEGQGSAFTITLPLIAGTAPVSARIPAPSGSREASEMEKSSLSGLLAGLRILVVDDDCDTLELQALVLEQSGADVKAVASGAEALQVLEQFVPDLLVSDIGMAGMDGYMLIQQVRSRSPDRGGTIRAIALTAYAGDFDRHRAIESGFEAHVTKPVEPERLVKKIAQLCGRSGGTAT